MRDKGTTLTLTVAIVLVVVVVGVGAFCLIQLFGGARELQTLTDSGTLNIGKQMVTVGIPLKSSAQQADLQFMNQTYQPDPSNWQLSVPYVSTVPINSPADATVTLNSGIEGSNFAYLSDQNGNITLQNYNRVIAQTAIVGLNAQAEATIPAIANAQALFDVVQRNSDSISARLLTRLNDPAVAAQMFMNTGMGNSLRMLGAMSTPSFVSANFAVSYSDPGSPTNVWIDPSILPSGITLPTSVLSSVKSPAAQPYINGYTTIDTGPFTIEGTPVFPMSQPHLISLRDFHAGLSPPIDLGYVAPNSFGATGSAVAHINNKPVSIDSSSIVGVLTPGYPASISCGYLAIYSVLGKFGEMEPLSQMLSPYSAADQQAMYASLTQRVREIDPTLSANQVQSFLKSTMVSAYFGQPTYIYLYPDLSNPLYAPWHQQLVQAGGSQGNPGQLFASQVPPPGFPIVQPSTVPSQEMNLLGVYPDGSATMYYGPGVYTEWIPSSGYNRLLGVLVIP
ncbi:MAG TPA: hypothetical protein V6D22_07625 [Candidatus Obscuribacterales bacterium]